MRTIATVLLLALGMQAAAQKMCATAAYAQHISADDATRQRMAAVENFIQAQKLKQTFGASGQNETKAEAPVIRIPVVVHVVYQTAAQNISEEKIKSQIAALNRDFRRQNSDTVNTPERFKAFAADVAIEFELATADPMGRPTNGIVRKQTGVRGWQMDDKIKSSKAGGADGWDSKSYLNIWVGNLSQALGYASVPGSDAALDGVVINTSAFGTIGTAAPYNMGRTTVHEVGHWLGLKHIWGDAACGDDNVGDTPKQGSFTTGSPTGFRSSCSNAPLGDMYMNYMDFTDDKVMNLFTHGQKDRMRALFNTGGPRNSLLRSKGLNEPWLEEALVTEPIAKTPEETIVTTPTVKIFPNPAASTVTVNVEADWIGKELQLVNLTGTVVQRIRIQSSSQKINVHELSSGIYFLQGRTAQSSISHKMVKL